MAATIGDDNVIAIPAQRDQHGRRLMIFRLGRWEPDKYGVDEIFRGTLACLELGVLEPQMQILGGVALFDLEGLGMKHARKVTTLTFLSPLHWLTHKG